MIHIQQLYGESFEYKIFSKKKSIDNYLKEARGIVEFILNDGFEKASQKFSKKSLI
jgi:hypothetical protein